MSSCEQIQNNRKSCGAKRLASLSISPVTDNDIITTGCYKIILENQGQQDVYIEGDYLLESGTATCFDTGSPDVELDKTLNIQFSGSGTKKLMVTRFLIKC